MLIDDVTIRVHAGAGGDGAVAFNKNVKELGPVGGAGGDGGSIFFRGTSNLGALAQFRHSKQVRANDGEGGHGQFVDGTDGKDITVEIPVGTVVHNLDTNEDIEITAAGQTVRVARGGKGGRGNFHFRSSTNTSPRQFEKGTPGEQFRVRLELKLIADIGFIGLPNAGKSSLINELTRAKSKVANYPFTTLEPHLGSYYGMILADIPGLIEGASSGRGLGTKFLRHIERTRVLFHLVSAEDEHPEQDYETVRNELLAHNPELLQKTEYVFLTKSDTVAPERVAELVALFKKRGISMLPISIHDWDSIEAVRKLLNTFPTKTS